MTFNSSRRQFLKSSAATLATPLLAKPMGPEPYGALPAFRQLDWASLEYYNFLHFTVNTFTDREWGKGDEDPAIFNPTAFDADAICEALRASGSKGVILTCKHHDGFCLWPTKTTEHSIAKSPYRDGKGDIVKEVSAAAERHDLKFGVYLSPWDRNQATYGTPEYIDLYRRQMRELLTGYGKLFEIWHDGANGGDGYYGGANEKRTIDKKHYYDWENTWKLESQLQPDACRFSDVGPDIRWVGNEKGIAGDPCWDTFTPVGEDGGVAMPGDVDTKESNSGTRGGKLWMPAECDVSIRPGWFWHEKENDKVKTPQELFNLHLESVGRGAGFLLNVPPDRRGLLHEADVASLKAFGKMKDQIFGKNLLAGGHAQASNTRGGSALFSPAHLVDGKPDTYWCTNDGVTTAEATVRVPKEIAFNLIRVREALPLGQRVAKFSVDCWAGGDWRVMTSGTSIGNCKILRLKDSVRTDRVRLRITASPVCPALTEFALFSTGD